MADLGLLQGISEGFKSGLQNYQEQKQRNFNNRLLLADMMTKGIVQDDQGNLGPSQGLLAKQSLDLAKNTHDIQGYDPNSDYSKSQVQLGNKVAQQAGLGQGLITDGTSAADVNSDGGIIKTGIQGGFNKQAGQIKATSYANANASKNQSFADKDAVSVSKDYESALKPYRQVNEDVRKIEGTLNTKDKNGNPLISAQQLGDVNAAIARIYSPGHMSDATVSRTEYESIPAKFAAAVQRWSTNPQDVQSKALIDHIIDQAHHLANVSNDNAERERQSLDSGYENLQVPSAKKTAQDKSKYFQSQFTQKYPENGQPGQGLLNQSPPPPKPGDVVQGHRFKGGNPADPNSWAAQ